MSRRDLWEQRMADVHFTAPEYQADGSFQSVTYEYSGDVETGWTVERDGHEFLHLGPGYDLVESAYCGVCSTDLARRFLPYPLPQIIGHEVVARHHGRPVVIEINASHAARGLTDIQCAFCNNDMNTQCPHRITLGIDRLPGGFAPYILAPINAIVPIPENVSELAAALTEPFAAALQGVEATAPREQDRVAVLGPRRLGSLIIAALAGYRNREQADFEIAAIARHDHLLKL
ncbi:MAG: alcohol dehydrogenase catalytic domain-containing protein, partial [Leptospiraceae bacterium]|nr:alcohol dehydrogenase catalytic domain-containing protein [Leptospiraceae bacterium]